MSVAPLRGVAAARQHAKILSVIAHDVNVGASPEAGHDAGGRRGGAVVVLNQQITMGQSRVRVRRPGVLRVRIDVIRPDQRQVAGGLADIADHHPPQRVGSPPLA